MPVDPRHLRTCLGRFTTGVTVVTYDGPLGVRGATVNAFTSVSLAPPLVLVSLGRDSRAAAALTDRPFAVNVLRADQVDVALQFAGRPRPGARVAWRPRPVDDAPPALADTVATFHCTPWRQYDGGDHVLVVGEVTSAETGPGEPLLFGSDGFAMTGLPLFDGPLVHDHGRPPAPSWAGVVRRLHHGEAV